MSFINILIEKMTEHNKGDAKRIQHFMKVYGFSKFIGEMEGLDSSTQGILEMAAVLHDIGVRPAEEKYGNCAGPNQEREGVAAAEKLLDSLGKRGYYIGKATKERVCYLIGHHHTYSDVDGMDYQILLEADFLVNLYEKDSQESEVRTVYEKIFRTEWGRKICRDMFGI